MATMVVILAMSVEIRRAQVNSSAVDTPMACIELQARGKGGDCHPYLQENMLLTCPSTLIEHTCSSPQRCSHSSSHPHSPFECSRR